MIRREFLRNVFLIISLITPVFSFAQDGIFHELISEGDYELFLITGDSNADGVGESIPTVPPGTLYLWNGSSIDEITTQTVANGGSYGSAWQQFAIDYKAAFGKRVVIVNKAVGGSEFYPNGDNTNWYTSGTLYSPAISDALAAKAYLKVSRISVIVCLGINDIRGAQTSNNVISATASLHTRLTSDLSTPQVYYVVPGRTESIFNNDRSQQIRRGVVNVGLETNAHIASCMLPFENWGLYAGDDLHLTQAGYDLLGSQIVRYIVNSSYSKHARSIISSFKDDVSSAKKTAINNFVGSFAAISGTVDGLYIFAGPSRENIMIDWGLVAAPLDLGVGTFVANDCISLSGSTQLINTTVLQTSTARSTNTDFVEFVKTGTVATPGSTSAYLFGKANSTIITRTFQGSSQLDFQAYDGTSNPYTSETKYANDAIYAIARNGTNKMLKKDAANVVSVTQSSTGSNSTQPTYLGTHNANGTPAAQYIQSEYKAWGLLQLSDITWSSFVTELNTLLTAMETP